MEIQSNIPLPKEPKSARNGLDSELPRKPRPTKNRAWPFKRMLVGDSVFIPEISWPAAQNIINTRRHRGSQDFTWRREAHGVRVWCIKRNGSEEGYPERIEWGFSRARVGDVVGPFPAQLYARAKNAMRSACRLHNMKFDYAKNDVRCLFKRIE